MTIEKCPNCQMLEERVQDMHSKLERIREILAGNGDARRGRPAREYLTEYGRMIAAAASAKNKRLSEISRDIGYASDHVAKVCRGDITLSRRLALLIGQSLGIDLMPYVKDDPATIAKQLPLEAAHA